MTAVDATSCPACRHQTDMLMTWPFSGFDGSIFNMTAVFRHCPNCGLVYLANIDDESLIKYYTQETIYDQKGHFDVDAPANIEKYRYYHAFLKRHGLGDRDLADIGCGRGGFVNWIARQGWSGDLCGVDVDIESLAKAVDVGSPVSFENGTVTALPFDDGSQDILSYFHVFEHLRDLDIILSEASRTLKPGGHILFEVPDAERYDDHPIGTAFWMGIREHITHFTGHSLCALLDRTGFSLIDITRDVLPTPEFEYPSLMTLAQKTDEASKVSIAPTTKVLDHAKDTQSILKTRLRELNGLVAQHDQTVIWGMSEPLFSMLPHLDLTNVRLCDANAVVQTKRFRGQPVHAPETLEPEGVLVIAPYQHGAVIERAALSQGWHQDQIHHLK